MILRFIQDYHITLKIGGINRQILFILPGNEANNLSMILYLKSRVNIQSIFWFLLY